MRRNSLVHSGNLALALDQAQYRGLKFCAMKIAAFQPSGKGKKCGGRPADIADPGRSRESRTTGSPSRPRQVKQDRVTQVKSQNQFKSHSSSIPAESPDDVHTISKYFFSLESMRDGSTTMSSKSISFKTSHTPPARIHSPVTPPPMTIHRARKRRLRKITPQITPASLPRNSLKETLDLWFRTSVRTHSSRQTLN